MQKQLLNLQRRDDTKHKISGKKVLREFIKWRYKLLSEKIKS